MHAHAPRAVVWITGASSGIGAALASTVPFEDADVFDVSRSGGGPGTTHVPADLSDTGGWRAVRDHLTTTLDAFAGELAVFVHNAGTLEPMGIVGTVDQGAYERQVLLNAAAPQVLGNAFLTAVRGRGLDAHLLMLSSGAASKPYEGWSAYCAGKAAVDHWVRTVGAEQHRTGGGCRVVAVAPGVVETPMQARIRSTDEADFPARDKFVELHERGELRDPVDAARGIWSLLGRELDNGAVVDLRSL